MSDDRLTGKSNPPRCPVCATGYTATPGANCPACGRSFALPNASGIPDLRRNPQNARTYRLQELLGVIFAIFVLAGAGVVGIANNFPGVLVPIAVLLVPALVRTVRLANLPRAQGASSPLAYLLWSLLASFGIVSVAGIASFIAFCAICLPVALAAEPAKSSLAEPLAGIVGVGLFVFLFYKLWPRESEADAYQRSPDPEN